MSVRSALRPIALGLLCAALTRPLAGQGDSTGWQTAPRRPTVGDTIWLWRVVAAPPGWHVRAGKIESSDQIEALADPIVRPGPGGWVVAYAIAAWTPGPHLVALPPIWRFGPSEAADSLPASDAPIAVQSVIADTATMPQPRAALGPMRRAPRRPLRPAAALGLALALGAAGVAWRRRAPRPAPPAPAPLRPAPVPDARWLAAGEPKAVAARARAALRGTLARAHPEAPEALSTAECLAVLEPLLARASFAELALVLAELDRVSFASAHGSDVEALAARARALAATFA